MRSATARPGDAREGRRVLREACQHLAGTAGGARVLLRNLGVGLRLLNVRAVSVADMLPALIVAPLLTVGVQALLG